MLLNQKLLEVITADDLTVTLTIDASNGGLTNVDWIQGDPAGQNVRGTNLSPLLIERVAAVIRMRRLNYKDTRFICAQHGYYDSTQNNGNCAPCLATQTAVDAATAAATVKAAPAPEVVPAPAPTDACDKPS